MRFAFAVMLLGFCGALCAQETLNPRESYEAFVDAVLDDALDEEQRTDAFERYFDFDAWVQRQQADREEPYTAEEVSRLRDEWFQVFRSEEFRRRYERGNVEVERELLRDNKEGKAELLISMDADSGAERFRVLMNLSEDGTYWRWYAIPRYEGDDLEKTPEERLAEIDEQLQAIAERRRELEALAEELRRQAGEIRAEIAEADAGETPYATPGSVVKTAWKAIEDGDADALLNCHTFSERARQDHESGKLTERVKKLKDRLMAWEVLDTTVNADDPGRATVRVKLTLQRTGTPDERTISVKVRRVDDEWKIDEVP